MICFNILYILSGNYRKRIELLFLYKKIGITKEHLPRQKKESLFKKSCWYRNMNENFKYNLYPLCSLNHTLDLFAPDPFKIMLSKGVSLCRECVRAGAAGSRTRRSSGDHL